MVIWRIFSSFEIRTFFKSTVYDLLKADVLFLVLNIVTAVE